MATANFQYRSRKIKAQLTLRFRHYQQFDDGRKDNFQVDIKTKEIVSRKQWEKKTYSKEFERKLEDVEDYVIKKFNEKYPNLKVTQAWLQAKYDEFINGGSKPQVKTLLTEWIQQTIDDLKADNMSTSTIKTYVTYKGIIEKYNPYLYVPDLTQAEFIKLKRWLAEARKYDVATIEKLLDDLKTVCRNARSEGVILAKDFDNIKVRNRRAKARESKRKTIIFLTPEEITSIENLDLKQNYLVNARKWLVLGIYTAQRGNDLLNRIVKDNFIENKKGVMIQFTQQKTGERMEIKALPKVKKMYFEDSLPTKISVQKLNKYVKELCVLAKIDTPTKAKSREKIILEDGEEVFRNIEKVRPKHKYIASHTFRRTFCTLHFRKLPNEEIMKYSGHKTTREFLGYVGEKDNDFSAWDKLYKDEE